MVVEVAAPREPDAAAQHGELTAQPLDTTRLAEEHRVGSRPICIELRIHHESPDQCGSKLIPHCLYDRRQREDNPMNSSALVDAELI